MKTRYVNVALPVKINSLFLYSLPEGASPEEVIGKRVLVDFNNRLLRGYAVSEGKYTDAFMIKPIKKILDKQRVFINEMVETATWIASYYFAGIGEVLSLMVPKGIKPGKYEKKTVLSTCIKKLSEPQENVYNSIKKDIKSGINKFYLYGITGSGKTEIYIRLIEDAINKNQNVIFLVPEIALSYQTLNRLEEVFGELCAVLHSTLKGSVRLGEHLRIMDKKARIVIGPRSAVFAPFESVGLIIIDEENEGAYKSEESPRFHARSVAQYLAIRNNAAILLGSATPSVESWFYAKKNFFKLYLLRERYGGAVLPEMEIIDCSKYMTTKNLTLRLVDEINKRLQRKEQVVLLQNRRGFANFIKCDSCKAVIECPRCSLSLTYHKTRDRLICHHCGYHAALPERCPACNNNKLLKIGAGTQRIEEEISGTFMHANIQRMDQDSFRGEKDYKEIFDKIEKGEIDIIVGTQMIAKGLHFPNIKFVGIINADLILNIPDFKAGERTFSLITQVAGRAGREGEKGLVMIQTMNPEHYAIISAKNNDYEEFYSREIEYRRMMNMPPFYRLIRLVIRGNTEEKTSEDIGRVSRIIRENNSDENILIMGPAPCLFFRINNYYRYQILLKSRRLEDIQKLVRISIRDFNTRNRNYLEIDVDPVNLL